MEAILFDSLVVVLGAGVAIGAYGIWLYTRLSRLRGTVHPKVDRSIAAVMVGSIVTKGVILTALLGSGEATPSAAAWIYLGGALVQMVGVSGLVRRGIEYLAETEVDNVHNQHVHDREEKKGGE